jgi:tetratricopeptide (TPR) repeat protein
LNRGRFPQVPPPVQAWRWAKRHRSLVTGLAATLLAVVIGLGIVSALQERSNRQLAAKNEELFQARLRAEKREQLALQAIDNFEQAVENNLDVQNRPELEPLRQKLLDAPLRFYRDFRADPQAKGDTRPESLRQLGRAVIRLAYLTAEIGSETQAAQFYREAIDILEPLVRDQPHVAWNQAALATAYNNLGNLYQKAGKPAEARAAHERALALRESLVRAHPDNAVYHSNLGSTCHNLGWLLESLGEPVQALASYREAVAHRELAFGKDADRFGTELARTYNNLGALQAALGQKEEARRTHERARDILEPLVHAHPQEARYRPELAMAYHGLGEVAEGDESLVHRERARQIREALVHERPAVTQWRVWLASSYRELGTLHGKAQRFPEALASMHKAGDLLEGIVREHPEVASYRYDLANYLNHLGLLLNDSGRPAEALPHHERAHALVEGVLRENPDNLEARSLLGGTWNNYGWALAKLGRHEEAVAAYRTAIESQRLAFVKAPQVSQYRTWLNNHYSNLVKSFRALDRLEEAEMNSDERMHLWIGHPEESRKRYDQACELALLAAATGKGKGAPEFTGEKRGHQQRLADRAMESLRQAIRGGYANLARIKKDTDLDSLRGREDFQKLIHELGSKEKRAGS